MSENHTPQKVGEIKYYSKGQAALFLGVGTRSIERWMSRGWLRFSKLPNGQVRFRENDLLTTMDRQRDLDRNASSQHDPSMG